MQVHKLLLALGAGAIVSTGASAAIVSATVADVSSEFGPLDDLQDAIRTVDGSGLDDSDPNPLNWTHGNGFPDGGGAGLAWHSDGVESPADVFITYDLGGVFDLNAVLVWNFNNAFSGGPETGRGFNQYDLLVSSDNVNFTQIVTDGNLLEASGTDAETAQVINVAGNANGVRYVRIEADSNFGTAGPWTGLSEVRFDVVPEPGSLALLALGGLTLLRRRR